MMNDDIVKAYNEIKADYKDVKDNDPASAYDLMVRASTLMETLETQVAVLYKELAGVEQNAKALMAEKSAEFSNKVAVGDRHTLTDNECKEAWSMVAEVQYSIRLLEASVKFLNRVYFDMKNNVAFNRGAPKNEG